jgi:hypothetical protein
MGEAQKRTLDLKRAGVLRLAPRYPRLIGASAPVQILSVVWVDAVDGCFAAGGANGGLAKMSRKRQTLASAPIDPTPRRQLAAVDDHLTGGADLVAVVVRDQAHHDLWRGATRSGGVSAQIAAPQFLLGSAAKLGGGDTRVGVRGLRRRVRVRCKPAGARGRRLPAPSRYPSSIATAGSSRISRPSGTVRSIGEGGPGNSGMPVCTVIRVPVWGLWRYEGTSGPFGGQSRAAPSIW